MVTVASHNPSPIERGVVIGSLSDTKRQVITIHRDGSISGLVHKPGSGLEILSMGQASVMRASEVLWVEKSQNWAVRFLTGPRAGQDMTWADMDIAYPDLSEKHPETKNFARDGIVSFRSYELAVEGEIAYFNAQRLAGNLSEVSPPPSQTD